MDILDVFSFVKQKSELCNDDKEDIVKEIISWVGDGDANPVDVYALLHFFQSAFEEAKGKIKEQTIQHIEKGDNEGYGIALSVYEHPTYGYKFDKRWQKLANQLGSLEENLQKRQETLKAETTEARSKGENPPIPVDHEKRIRVSIP